MPIISSNLLDKFFVFIIMAVINLGCYVWINSSLATITIINLELYDSLDTSQDGLRDYFITSNHETDIAKNQNQHLIQASGKKMKDDNGRLTPNNEDETILSIKQWQPPNAYVDIRVPIPEQLVLVEKPDSSPHLSWPSLIYVSSLDNWNKVNSDQPFIGKLLRFTILAPGLVTKNLSDLEKTQEIFSFFSGGGTIFWGDIPDTNMGFVARQNNNEFVRLFGLTKIDTEYVGVEIVLWSQEKGLSSEDFEICKNMMENYFVKLKKINDTPLVPYELKPVKQIEKCAIPGGASVADDGETIFTFRDCVPRSFIEKKVPLPAGFEIAENDSKLSILSNKLRFVSNVETWRKYGKKKNGEPFNERLLIFDVRKGHFSNDQEARNEIRNLMGTLGELKTFGDLPDTYMAYHSYHPSVCGALLMGNTKIFDEYVEIFLNVMHGCLPDRDEDDVYKKMMVDYFQKIREINLRRY